MRYWLAAFLFVAALVVSVAGLRGSLSRKPPRELFPDMVRQSRLRPQARNDFFADTFASRQPVAGTVPRGSQYENTPLHTGLVAGTTNWVACNPVTISPELLLRGQERFQVFCQACHGAAADGRGIATKYGLVVIANLHDPRIVRMPEGELFHVISNGRNRMPTYGADLAPGDRWAIISYVRALHLTRLGLLEDVPAEHQAALGK
jgi:mono/diheme cytochrome c family protein